MALFRLLSILAFCCVASASSAQSWKFTEPSGPDGIARLAGDEIEMSFACRTRTDTNYDPDNLIWRLAGIAIGEHVTAAAGDVVRLGLSLDGQSGGEGPFLMSDSGDLATNLPRALPFLAAMKEADEISLRLNDDQSVSIPLEGLGAALDQLTTWCDREDEPTPQPDLSADACAAPVGATAETICGTPELRTLEAEMNDVYRTRLVSLDERARALLETEQSSWTDFRENCADSSECISKATRARISRLTVAKAEKPVAVAVQTRPEPPRALSVPLTPLQPAELGQVIWDPKQTQMKLTIEVVRARPELLQNENVLRSWARLAFEGQSRGQDGQLAIARDHLSRSIAANPPGPFLIGRIENNPLQVAQYENGKLTATNANQTPVSGWVNISVSGVTSIELRAISQFEVSELAMNPEQAAYIQQQAAQLSLGIVAQIDGIDVHGSSQTNFRTVARGQVRFAGLFNKPAGRNPKIDPNQLVAVFPPKSATPPVNGFAGVSSLLGIGLHQGVVLEGQSYDAGGRSAGSAAQLMRLANLKGNAPEQLDDRLRAEVFFQLATQQERDAVIPPHHFGRNARNNNGFTFDQSVDEFERGELLDRVDQMLWPVVKARLPEFPFDVIARIPATLGEYDRSLGGFAINSSGVGALGVAAQGQYPAFSGMPDFLPSPMEQARQLVAYLESKFGPGNRQMTLVARYRVTGARVQQQQNRNNETLLPIIEPQSVSLHAYNQRDPDPDPMGQQVIQFDLAAYRGPDRPVADPETVSFWADVRQGEYSTSDDIVGAALKLSAMPDYLSHLVQNSNEVRSAGQFDRVQVVQDMQVRLASLEMPEMLKLTGEVSLGQYNVPDQFFPVAEMNFRYSRGEIGVQGPVVQLVTPELLGRLQVDVDTARRLLEQDRRSGNSVPFVVWAKPSIANFEGRRGTLYIEPQRIVFYSNAQDGTGYPAAYVEIEPEATQNGTVAATDLASVALQAPGQIPLDSDYLDLLMIRDAQGDVSEATWARMMYDRMLREQVARDSGYPLAWGWFFPPGVGQMDPIRAQVMQQRFQDWSVARAAALPDEVFVQQSSGNIGGGFQCWSSYTPPMQDFERSVPPVLAKRLKADQHSANMQMRQIYQQRVRGGARALPDLQFAVFGSPSLVSSNQPGSTRCNASSRNRLTLPPEQMQGMQSDVAMITVRGAIRKPLERVQEGRVFRDIGIATAERSADGILQIVVDVTRSEIYAAGKNRQTGRMALEIIDTLTTESLPEPPLTTDIFEIVPGMNWDTALQSGQNRLPEAIIVENAGGPGNFRMVSNNALLEPMAQFQAYHNGNFLFSKGGNEALAIMREPDRDPDRVLAVGSHRVFAKDAVTTDALIGALLRKYGPNPETAEDGGLYGPRPAQVLTWGARAGCVPQMRDQLRADLTAFNQDPDFQLLSRMAKAFRAPQLQYNGSEQLLYQTCAPAVWAMAGEDQQGQVHLVVWSLDLALLHEVAELEDTRPKIDGTEGSQSLIEKAADIDL